MPVARRRARARSRRASSPTSSSSPKIPSRSRLSGWPEPKSPRRWWAASWCTGNWSRRHPMLEDIIRESSLAEEFRDEGMREGIRDSIRVVLETRFGPLDEKMLAAIQQLAGEDLHELIALSAKGTLEEVRARLGVS